MQEADTLFPRALVQGLPLLLDPVFRVFLYGAQLVSVVVALERRRYRKLQFLDEMSHVFPEFAALPGRESQRMGPLRVREIVDVAPVRRRAPCFRLFADKAFDQRVPVAANRSQHVNVVTGLTHRDAKANRVDRALLADVRAHVLICVVFEVGRQRAQPAQCIRLDPVFLDCVCCHGLPRNRAPRR